MVLVVISPDLSYLQKLILLKRGYNCTSLKSKHGHSGLRLTNNDLSQEFLSEMVAITQLKIKEVSSNLLF